jgi:hypothetical protein
MGHPVFTWKSEVETSPRESIHTEISPLRFAPVEMTKGRGGAPMEISLPNRTVSAPLTLTLLVLRVLTDNAYDSATMNYLALVADLFY